jgi:hypothetical protein
MEVVALIFFSGHFARWSATFWSCSAVIPK